MKLLLNDGRITTFLGVFHAPGLARNLISINKMGDVGVQTILKKTDAKWFEEQWY